MAKIGYARVSTNEQHLDLQLSALQSAGCGVIYKDYGISAIARNRPGFEEACQSLARGDTLAIWKMDRAFRSVLHAAATLEEFRFHRIELECLTEPIDLDTAYGRCMYHVRNAIGELEREFISERTLAGLQAARERGARLGRPRKLGDQELMQIQRRLEREPDASPRSIANDYGVSPRTIARALQASGAGGSKS